MKAYTGIGSRDTPMEICAQMTSLAEQLRELSWTLRSGHADGADKAFELGAGNCSQIFLPWPGFNGAFNGVTKGNRYIVPILTREMIDIAAAHHPAWEHCSQGAKKLHCRNVCQVLGLQLDSPSKMVICWTPRAARGGGTGQALRIAETYDIPIFDLARGRPVQEELESFLSSFKER